MEKKKLIEAGRIVNTHGVQGEVKIEVWLDSPRFFKSFRRLVLPGGGELKILSAREHKGFVIARLEGTEDVNAAMRLKGQTVFVRREDAALPRGAFFLQDIIGAKVEDEEGRVEHIAGAWYDDTRGMLRLTLRGVKFEDYND